LFQKKQRIQHRRYFSMTKLSVRETPGYRAFADITALSSAELIAAMLPGRPTPQETAGSIVSYFHGDLHLLFQAGVSELVTIPGVGEVTAIQLKAALTLAQRAALTPLERAQITCPSDIHGHCLDMAAFEVEVLRVIALSTKSHILGIHDVYRGSVSSSQVRIAEVFKPAIARQASAIVVAHNHPSGDPNPSPDDVAVTRAMLQAGKLLSIELLDHVVIGQGKWVSLKERGLGFS
jgi:DNA repair protein RadC